MELKDNPLLQPENYQAGYQESIEALKNHPEIVSYEKITHEMLNSEAGQKWIEITKTRYLIPGIVDRNAANYQLMVIWEDGFKDFARMMLQHQLSHEQRIKAGGEPTT
jgi:hypothetical protein